jgi:hypothetical protein
VNGELERVWKEVVLAYSEVLYRNLTIVSEENHGNFRSACLRASRIRSGTTQRRAAGSLHNVVLPAAQWPIRQRFIKITSVGALYCAAVHTAERVPVLCVRLLPL